MSRPGGRLVASGLLLLAGWGLFCPGLPAASADPTFTVETTAASPSPVTRGTFTTVTTTILNSGTAAAGILVDMEIYDAAGNQVRQQTTTGQSFQAGQRRTFQWTWVVPASQAIGIYAIKIGVFSGDWATLYVWANDAASLAVQSGPITYTLTVTRAGSGAGAVASSPAGIACGTDCTESYASGTAVTLTATAGAGSVFAGWSGACAGSGPCGVTMSAVRSVTATFSPTGGPFSLAVSRAGTGIGVITSSPAGIACGTDCTESYASGTAVTLTATAGAGSVFAGWSGACTGSGACAVTMAGDRAVTARFDPQPTGPPSFAVETTVAAPNPVARSTSTTVTTSIVNTGGPASGIIVDMEIWAADGSLVRQQFTTGQSFQAGERRSFQWTWAVPASQATGTYPIQIGVFSSDWATNYVWVDQAASLGVEVARTLTVTRAGTGTGAVTSSPAGIACGADCTEVYASGASVTLTATADAGSTFTGWGGACTGTGSCVVPMTAARSVTATFTTVPGPATLTVARAGTGTGAVTSSPAGIACGADCTEVYATGTSVTLTATADAGSTFTGWSGACTGTGPCVVPMTAARSVTATFSPGAFTLTVARAGGGAGSVASSPAGIACGADCTEAYATGTSVTLTATADAGSTFTGWSGACTGTGPCAVTMSGDLAVTATFVAPGGGASNPIAVENRQAGTTAWQLGGQVPDDSTGQIQGYASAISVGQNASITFHVSVNPAQTYTIDVYRVGWYGGAGGRHLASVGPLAGTPQPGCPVEAETGLVACAWAPGHTLTVPGTWTSGIHLAVLTSREGYQSYVIFVVRDTRPAAIVYQQSVTTYQAYNNYPDDGSTGKSLYDYNSHGAPTVTGDRRAVKVSFDRPYSGTGAGQFLYWEINLVRWLERNGYDVTYTTNLDTHVDGDRLRQSRAFLSVGHDEYWSKAMFDAVESARDAGVSLAFLGANAAYWQVRLEPSAGGVPNRVMVGYKYSGYLDPIQGPTTTVQFREPPVNRPEQTLIGIQYASYVDWGANVAYVVTNAGHPVFAGTGFSDGDAVPGIVGYEMDRTVAEYPLPASTTRAILSRSPYTDVEGRAESSESAIYRAPSGAWVFAAGTISWSWGLDGYGEGRPDARIEQTMRNVLDLLLAGSP